MRQHWFALALVLCLLIPTFVMAGEAPAETVPAAVKSITAKEIGGHLRFLASDLMKGRDTATPESRMAAEYLAAHLFAAGAEPLGDQGRDRRTYFQRFPLEVVTPREEGTDLSLILELNGSRRVVPCKLGTDFVLVPRGIEPGEVEAPIVFAGYGRVDPDRKIDDYAGLDVKNRFVLVYSGRPGAQASRPRGEGRRMRPLSNVLAKREPAQQKGALGLLEIQPPGSESPVPEVPASGRNLGFSRPNMTLSHAPTSVPAITLADPIRDLLVATFGLTTDTKGQLLGGGGVRARFRFAATTETKQDRNVIGFFPGSDPEKKKEIVVYSAHYDHVGVDETGEIFNGSDDNASGTSTLLEIAQAFGQGPRPARSVAFLWVSGEEKGLLGSHWFADHMNLPADHKIIADINLDMVSRNDPKKVGVTPSPKHADYNSLVPAAQSSCRTEGMEVVFDADEFYFRTDSYSFASKGIPSIFFFSGIHADYHRPTDDIEKADLEKAARVARAAYRLGWQVAQGPDAPKKIKVEPKAKVEPAITRQLSLGGLPGPVRAEGDDAVASSGDAIRPTIRPNQRYFIDQNGSPVFWLGTTQWQLFREYKREDTRTILEKTKEKGFAFAQVMLLGVGDGTKANIYGEKPWASVDPLVPNEAYFANVDSVLRIAGENNVVISLTLYHQRWRKLITEKTSRSWAKWLAQRYKSVPNIVWSMTPEAKPEFVPVLRELAAGLREGDLGAHLITFKPDPAPYSSSFIHGEKWLDYDSMQTWKSVDLIYPFVTKDYNLKPVKPVLMAEGAYEHGSEYGFDVTPLLVRRQAYYSYLAGAHHTYGHNDSWRVLPTWKQALDAPGAVQMGILRKVFEARKEWWHLVPDQTIFASGGNTSGKVLNLAARHKDGKWLMVYLGNKATFAINRSKFTEGRQASAFWIDPRTGKSVFIGEVPNSGVQQFTTPEGWEDALLILE